MADDGCNLDCATAWSHGDACRHGVKQTGTFQVPAVVRLNKQLKFMWQKHGPGPEGKTCKGCIRLRGHRTAGGRTYYKCLVYGVSSGPGTDWRLRWPACGLFEENTNGQNK